MEKWIKPKYKLMNNINQNNNLQQKESRGKIAKWSFDKKESNPKKSKSNSEANTYKGNENRGLN